MKPLALVATLALFAMSAAPALAQMSHDAHSHAPAAVPVAATAASTAKMSEGAVRKVDKAAGKITIAHGPLENLGMPAMTMAFRAGNAAMLDQVKTGDRIRFVAERVDGVFTVTQLEVAR